MFAKFADAGFVSPEGGAGRATDHFGNLFKGQSAPVPGHDDFPLFAGEPFQGGDGGIRVEAIDLVFDEPPFGPGDGRFAAPPPQRGPAGVDCPVAHDTIQPGYRVGRRLPLPNELDESFLDDILRFPTPLPCAKHQRGGMLVNELCDLRWGHQHRDDAEGVVFRRASKIREAPKVQTLPGGSSRGRIEAIGWSSADS